MRVLPIIGVLALLLPTSVRALSRDELLRYGFSKPTAAQLAPESGRDADAPIVPATRDRLSPHLIPSPFVRPLGTRSFEQPRVDARGFVTSTRSVPASRGSEGGGERPKNGSNGPHPKVQGDARCLSCHEGRGSRPKASHRGFLRHAPSLQDGIRGCEACHGPGNDHPSPTSKILAIGKLGARRVAELCLTCHEMKRRIRPRRWLGSAHERANLACSTCHSEHAFSEEKLLRRRSNELCLSCHREQKHQFRRRSAHPLKGESFEPLRGMQASHLRCIDCHDPHGENGLDRERSVQELCSRCHPQHRGPFVFEHPVGTDLARGCLTCHLAHGSPNRRLMRVGGDRGTCLRCHADRVTHQSGQSCWNAACHRDVHGSNRDHLFRKS